MPGTHWLPDREQDFVDMCEEWDEGLGDTAVIAAFHWDPAEAGTTRQGISAFLTARALYERDNSSRNRLAKDEARKTATKLMQDFANTSIRYNKYMKEEDKQNYGVHTPDGSSTPVTAPVTFPEAEADTSVLRQVTIRFWDSLTKKRGKPHGVHGAEIRWALLDHPPKSVEDLINSDFDTATPYTLKFDETDRGKRLYFCLRITALAFAAGKRHLSAFGREPGNTASMPPSKGKSMKKIPLFFAPYYLFFALLKWPSGVKAGRFFYGKEQ
jgi:hypothetical protein